MREKVLITIRGAEEAEALSVPGRYYEEDGFQCLQYAGAGGTATIRFSPERAEILREGEALRELILIPGEETETKLSLVFGELLFRVRGEKLTAEERGNSLHFGLFYSLSQGEGPAMANRVLIEVRSEEAT